MFILKKESRKGRLGVIKTAHGSIETPFFMPDATRGFVKLLTSRELKEVKLKSLVVNTYHLFLQPGEKNIKKAGGIHKFMNWAGPILSDSGGFQVFSLIRQERKKSPLGKITERGVIFKSPLDGSVNELTPERSIQIQFDLGVDMMVCLDDCPPNAAPKAEIEKSVVRSIEWAKRCKQEFEKQLKVRKITKNKRPLLFSVIQGGAYLDLRKFCADELVKIGFDGYGFGAKPVDENGNFLEDVLRETASYIPKKSLRFALGIGSPDDILKCVSYGWDMFDCVIPTREGRHGRLFFWKGKKISTINISNSGFSKDSKPINKESSLKELREYKKQFLNHLFKLKEPLGSRLASLNNLEFYINLMEKIRKSI